MASTSEIAAVVWYPTLNQVAECSVDVTGGLCRNRQGGMGLKLA